MNAHFPVIHDAVLTLVNKFNRVFYRNNMIPAQTVGFVNHGGERCGFAATRGAGNQHKTARKLR